MRILLVDDDAKLRDLVGTLLEQWDHEVVHAANGVEALTVLETHAVQFVITDWQMPEMDGFSLCREIRSRNADRYVYIVLLTGQGDRRSLLEGMEAGADDFISKPFNRTEFKARIRAGMRVLSSEGRMAEQNETLTRVNGELREANQIISEGLDAASQLQRSLLPPTSAALGSLTFESLFLPCRMVAGDFYHFFPLDERRIVFYLLDVAGHGVRAAMLSVSLCKLLQPSLLAKDGMFDQLFDDPTRLCETLNRMYQAEAGRTQYFTMIYGVIETDQRLIRLVRAGHPEPMLLSKDGDVRDIVGEGYAVGLLPTARFPTIEVSYEPGDRLLLFSDGVSECQNLTGEMYSRDRLATVFGTGRPGSLRDTLDTLKDSLDEWRGTENPFDDDVSVLSVDFGENSSFS